jgi:hypothetical protein
MLQIQHTAEGAQENSLRKAIREATACVSQLVSAIKDDKLLAGHERRLHWKGGGLCQPPLQPDT